MSTVDFGSNVFYEPFTTPLTTLIDTLVIEVVIGEQIIIRECYDRCIIDLSRESFMVELYTLEWLNCRILRGCKKPLGKPEVMSGHVM